MSAIWNKARPVVAPGVDEVADIDVARCHHAIEWRLDLFKAGQLLQPADRGLLRHDIRFGDRDRGQLGRRVQAVGVALLLALPALNDELRSPLVGHLAEIRVGLRLLNRRLQLNELPLGLFELLIEIGGRDRREDLALGHMRADILVPGGDIAAGAGEERASVESGDVARQNQLLFSGSGLGRHKAHGRNGLGVGPGRNLLSALRAIHDA